MVNKVKININTIKRFCIIHEMAFTTMEWFYHKEKKSCRESFVTLLEFEISNPLRIMNVLNENLRWYSHLISAGGEFDFSLVRLPAHDCELGQLCFLKTQESSLGNWGMVEDDLVLGQNMPRHQFLPVSRATTIPENCQFSLSLVISIIFTDWWRLMPLSRSSAHPSSPTCHHSGNYLHCKLFVELMMEIWKSSVST